MKRVGKPIFFVTAILIVLFTVLSFTGIKTQYGDKETVYIKGSSEIRWGIDIRGGVDVTFTPPEDVKATPEQMNSAGEVMKQRLLSLNITDHELYIDTNKNRIIIRFPWKAGEANFDPEQAIKELGETADLTFREGYEIDEEGKMTGVTKENVILVGKNVIQASAKFGPVEQNGENVYYVTLKLDADGTTEFAKATEALAGKGSISIWMDDLMISNANVNSSITNGEAVISGNFDKASAQSLANKINAGALPFKLKTDTYSTITPTLGEGAKNAMLLSGVLAFIFVCIFMISIYRIPGFVACIGLLGQIGGTVAAISGFFDGINSFTLTVPGIAGIILGVGMGVDANIITSERIKEEIRSGKSLDGSIASGFERGFAAIVDGNVTTILIAIVLMGAFGSPNSFFSQLLKPIFFMFGPSTQGSIFSFGYTLTVSVLLNLFFGLAASRLMLKSISKFKCFRNTRLYGGAKND